MAVWLALLVSIAPMPFGAVTPRALTALRLTLLATGLLMVWLRAGWATVRPVVPAALALSGLALLALLQSVPWPLTLVRLLSPGHAALHEDLPNGALEAGRSAVALSLAPGASRSVGLTIAALVVALVAGALAGRSVRGRAVLLAGLAAGVGFQVLYGLRNWLAGSTEIWGREVQTPGGPRLRGTYVNSDHAAVLLEIGLAVSLAWLWWAVRRARRASALDRKLLLVVPPVALGGLAGVGVVLTGSRAALLAVAAGTTAQVLLMLGRRRLRWAPAVVAGLAVAAVALLWLVGEAGFGRLLGTSLEDVLSNPRFSMWRLAVALWLRFPWTGAGLGAWGSAVDLVQTRPWEGVAWTRAHNDYLELLATGGVVGVLCLCVAAGSLLRRIIRRVGAERSAIERATALAASGAVAAVGVHELFDFGLTLPANALAFLVLLGAASVSVVRRPTASGPSPVAAPAP